MEGNSPGRRVWAPGKSSKFSALNFGVAQFTDGETKPCWTPKLAPLHVRWQTPCQQQWLCSKLGFERGIYLIGFKATESFKLTPPISQAIGGGGEGGCPERCPAAPRPGCLYTFHLPLPPDMLPGSCLATLSSQTEHPGINCYSAPGEISPSPLSCVLSKETS